MYWLFCGWIYYPGGGLRDFQSAHDSIAEAKAEFEKQDYVDYGWAQIADMTDSIEERDKPFKICLECWEGEWSEPDT